jgi:hypothetical protein
MDILNIYLIFLLVASFYPFKGAITSIKDFFEKQKTQFVK